MMWGIRCGEFQQLSRQASDHLDRIGYQGWVGCEYKPLTSTEAGLAWLKTHNAVNVLEGFESAQ